MFSIFYSCSPTKYVGKDEYLLDRVKVKVDDHKFHRPDLKRNIRQKPNTRILGVARFHLGLYNLRCHEMLDTLLGERIALCDAGVGIGKTYAYLVACVLLRKYSMLTGRGNQIGRAHV